MFCSIIKTPTSYINILTLMSLQEQIDAKREELHDLQELKKFTGILVSQLEHIERKLDTMAGGAESVALILSNWQNVVNSVSLASLGLLKYTAKDYDEKTPLPECLVRIGLDKDSKEAE